ncbi:MAG: carbohydrate-binding protein [Verrucomicrobiota bacterium]
MGQALGLTIQANQFDNESHPTNDNIVRAMSNKVGFIKRDSWIRFNAFDFGLGASSLTVEASSSGTGGTLEMRQGSPNGTLIASLNTTPTGGWNTFVDFSTNSLNGSTTGEQNLYLVFKNSSASLFDVKTFRFD